MAKKKRKLSTREIVVFAMLGTITFLSKLLMEWAPNIHLVGMFIMVFTLVYRKKAFLFWRFVVKWRKETRCDHGKMFYSLRCRV